MARTKLTEEEKQEKKRIKELRHIWNALSVPWLIRMWISTLSLYDQNLIYSNFPMPEDQPK
jgi:hypothetical protein